MWPVPVAGHIKIHLLERVPPDLSFWALIWHWLKSRKDTRGQQSEVQDDQPGNIDSKIFWTRGCTQIFSRTVLGELFCGLEDVSDRWRMWAVEWTWPWAQAQTWSSPTMENVPGERAPVKIFYTPCMYRLITDVLGTLKTVSLRFDNVYEKNKV